MFKQVKSEKRTMLTELEAKELIKRAGVPVVDTRLAKSGKEAAALAKEIGFPVVMKIISPDIVHKSDIGGVKVGIANASQTLKAYSEMLAAVHEKQPQAGILGVSVQQMANPGVEIIIGMGKDAQFGPFLMFGLGGIWVEVMKDVAFRIVPVTRRDAAEMIREIKGFALLQGYRGQEPVDVDFLEKLIVKVSDFIEKNPQIKELDINPLIAYKDGAVAVDARVVLEG
jgi:acetate---CoA ligase (ADP-forming) subunit beta